MYSRQPHIAVDAMIAWAVFGSVYVFYLFGTKNLGSVTASNGDSFTYNKEFKYADYGAENCGSYQYNNTATIVETEQFASATLKVNVHCYIWESLWAKGVGEGVTARSMAQQFTSSHTL